MCSVRLCDSQYVCVRACVCACVPWLALCSIIMFTSQMAFYARVADPAMGGSYMTLLNTITNLGSMWNAQVGLRAISAIDSLCPGAKRRHACGADCGVHCVLHPGARPRGEGCRFLLASAGGGAFVPPPPLLPPPPAGPPDRPRG